MRYLTHIFSERKFSCFPSFQIVYEWEDILARELALDISSPGEITNKIHRRFENNSLVGLYNVLLPRTGLHLHFIMEADTRKRCWYNKNCIPVIIDFWLEEQSLDAFYASIAKVPLLLVTSMEVYDFLKSHDCPVPVEHWPLSYPDTHALAPAAAGRKHYEFVFFGRPDPFFMRLVREYADRHPDFHFIVNNGDINNRKYIDNDGVVVAEDKGRQSYLDMISSTKISCYSTPGIDESKKETTRFNQVTPRVFEMLCSGCQVIGHYPDNPDTEWYDLPSVVPNVDNYDEFEEVLDHFRQSSFDYHKISSFMSNHYTSSRAGQLTAILSKYGISIKPRITPGH